MRIISPKDRVTMYSDNEKLKNYENSKKVIVCKYKYENNEEFEFDIVIYKNNELKVINNNEENAVDILTLLNFPNLRNIFELALVGGEHTTDIIVDMEIIEEKFIESYNKVEKMKMDFRKGIF